MEPATNKVGEPVAQMAELAVGAMRMVKVDGQRVCLVRTTEGVFALDNSCPHMGYGLTTGSLSGDLLTCEWHNWKFRVSDGHCVVGEENVQTHHVSVAADGGVHVALRERPLDERRAAGLASLRSGIAKDYIGQVSRDVVRLLQTSVNPGELVWEAVAWGAPRAEFGWGHAVASATDCLSALTLYEGVERAFPVVQAIAGIAEDERDRPVQGLPEPLSAIPPIERRASLFRAMIEAEQTVEAQALLLGALQAGAEAADLQPWFTGAISDHLLAYGHGAIYAHKAFQLLDHLGWDRASTVLPYLVPTLTYATREDRLPYMKPFMRALAAIDLAALAGAPESNAWDGRAALVAALLEPTRRAPLAEMVAALEDGCGVDGLLDAVVLAGSERMLRYDVAGERDLSDDFGWLDITHVVTYANAARWHAQRSPGPDAVRLALFTGFLAHYSGRHEWHTRVADRTVLPRPVEDITEYGDAAVRASMLDTSGAFIVQAHSIKLSRAALEESRRLNSPVPLDAAWRFMHAPRSDRFVATTVQQSIDFLSGRVERD